MAPTRPKESASSQAAKDPEKPAGGAAAGTKPSPEAADKGSVSSEQAQAQRIAARLGIPYVDLTEFPINHDLFREIPVDLMFRYNFIPWKEEDGRLVVVISDPSDVLMVDELEILLGRPLKICVGAKTSINDVLKKSESSQRVLDAATEEFKIQVIRDSDGDEEGEEALSIDKLTQADSPIIKLVDSTIFNALQRRASDVHIETREREVIIKYRVDGVLYNAMDPIDKRFHSSIISRIKVMSELDIAEKRIPQDGRFKLKIKGRAIDFRVSIMPSVHGEDAVIRILDKESVNEEFAELRLDVLGFTADDLKRMRKFIREPYGMVLVTGPTGSGKTTTLYAALSEIRSNEDKIVTIEDPVEYQLPGITQIPVNEKKGLTFARGLRSILRHDPDKIMVGEIRDEETAQIAIQSALTGHLVFTTVHANNVVDVLGRFLNMKVEPYNFVSALNCVVAQRLVRMICPRCKADVRYTAKQLEESAIDPKKWTNHVFYEGKGCIDCNGTGYMGRMAIAEILDMSDRIRELILDRKSAAEIKRAAREEGMTFMRESAVQRVLEGKTTLREINKVTFVE
ncbi:MAG TPA: GspE/PulE family protein [Candidatus Polarisedimenticolia bacterium]|nr:GspE/PulE family protein [Candidatus Polarisedimenticolia bacterium]